MENFIVAQNKFKSALIACIAKQLQLPTRQIQLKLIKRSNANLAFQSDNFPFICDLRHLMQSLLDSKLAAFAHREFIDSTSDSESYEKVENHVRNINNLFLSSLLFVTVSCLHLSIPQSKKVPVETMQFFQPNFKTRSSLISFSVNEK